MLVRAMLRAVGLSMSGADLDRAVAYLREAYSAPCDPTQSAAPSNPSDPNSAQTPSRMLGAR